MKKTKIIHFLVVPIILMLCACYQAGTPAAKGLYAPYCVANINVPFEDNLNTTQFDDVWLIEKDAYGRAYYVYDTYSLMLEYHIEIHLIVQIEDENGQYGYYEDICYIIREAETAQFLEAEINRLKEINNWNQPLRPEQISYTSYEECRTQLRDDAELEAEATQKLGIGEQYGLSANGLESDGEATIFFACTFLPGVRGLEDNKFYLIYYEIGNSPTILLYEEVPMSLSPQEQIQAFRAKIRELQ